MRHAPVAPLAVFVWLLSCSAPRGSPSGELHECPDCPRLRVLPGGTVTLGSPDAEPGHKPNEGPQRAVTVASFAVATLETTRGQYAAFVTDTHRVLAPGCRVVSPRLDGSYDTDARLSWRDPGYPQTDAHPVVCVSWDDATDYAAWLSRRTGHHYRLLTDDEWEYAARAGSSTAFFWGADRELGCGYTNGYDEALRLASPAWPGTFAACDDGAVYTAPAGHYQPNAFGLFDMLGNVREWVATCIEPVSPAGCTARGVRGGSWDDDPVDLRSAARQRVQPSRRNFDLGFRVARDWP